MTIHIYEEKANFHGYPVKRLCIEGYERVAAVEESNEIAIFAGHPYASLFLTVNQVNPNDKLSVNAEGEHFHATMSKMIWGIIKNKAGQDE